VLPKDSKPKLLLVAFIVQRQIIVVKSYITTNIPNALSLSTSWLSQKCDLLQTR